MAIWQHLRSSTVHKRPTTSLADGRLAINTNGTSPGLFFKDSAGTGIVKVGPVHVGTTAPNSSPAVGGSSGNYTGEQWLDTSVAPAQLKVWNGSAWVGIVADELPVSKLQDGTAGQIVQTDSAGTGVEWSNTTNLPLGSAASPAYSFQGDSNTGIYSPGADQLAISTGGTGRLFVDAYGRATVAAAAGPGLTVNYPIQLTGIGSSEITTSDASGFYLTCNTNSFFLQGNSDFIFRGAAATSYAERLRITSDGKCGIGTSSPSQSLTTVGSIKIAGAQAGNVANLHLTRTDTSWCIKNETDLRFYYGAGDTDSPSNVGVAFTNTGKVGIGTLNPATKLDVAGNARVGTKNSNSLEFYIGSSWNTNDYYSIAWSNLYQTSSEIRGIQTDVPGSSRASALAFFTTDGGNNVMSERLRITSNGVLLVGTASTTANGGVLQISNGITFPGTQSACSDPNTLDDYEEGTWTPAIQGLSNTPTYDNIAGSYTKIGNVCHVQGFLQWSGATYTTSSAVFQISGLPFSPSAVNRGYQKTRGTFSAQNFGYNGSFNDYGVTGQASPGINGSGNVYFVVTPSNGTRGEVNNTAGAGAILEFDITYFA